MQKIAIVTGATSGIGRQLVLKLIEQNMIVIALGRSDEKIENLKIDTEALITDNALYVIKGDLNNIKSIEEIEKRISFVLDEHQYQIDYLIHVAGRVTSGYHVNKDQHEMTFAVNHLAVVLLTHLLIKRIRKSEKSRILVVSSQSHYRANINFNNLESKKFYSILRSYKRSKLYNVLFVKALASRFEDVPVYAIDPGLVRTKIGTKNTSKLASFVWNWRSKKGIDPMVAATHMYDVLTQERFDNISGSYIRHGQPVSSNPITYDKENIDKLWDVSLEMLDIKKYF
ncbi:SDR family NAD(P)-dependent oxidoreductase [Mariniplasma anaerobium]|uniref:Retinol dehydrogenase n=1 Tax=Mariniplasma anaerobium TaxID=2735436 RepID=A0A7U9TJG5_9MOLU|nr:SDR family NAD(P)-dependent oxidoreductase [Mariniplasma anaerobium]BCR36479.1 retinol dehydrogenase [Mariniplasma anaerobium]